LLEKLVQPFKKINTYLETNKHNYAAAAIALLQKLIATPSFSKEEDATAFILFDYLGQNGVTPHRHLNNVWATNKNFDPAKPTILLNSHHDTVKPNAGYTLDPYHPIIEDGKLYGLGSNDAGASLVSLLHVFLHYYNASNLTYNIIYAGTAEEEISGKNGIESLVPHLPVIDCAIIGEPTRMQLAVAERGLMVLDVVVPGVAGHAARGEGQNAIYQAIPVIDVFKNYVFPKSSELLGPVKQTVTVIETTNKAHNIVPPDCKLVVDVRVNECYTFEQILEELQLQIDNPAVTLTPRSTRLKSSAIALDHPLVKAGMAIGSKPYGSPTTSDKALVSFPALKMGPGESARSHSADEFVFIEEIETGIQKYIELLDQVVLKK
jgi:acetylornithine deacetylase/succinyl-diaminopimelate desuccinylase-like protein